MSDMAEAGRATRGAAVHWLVRIAERAGHRDKERPEIAALRAHAWHQEPQARRHSPHPGHLRRVGRADHEAHIALRVGGLRVLGHDLIQRPAGGIGLDVQSLKLIRAGVGCLAEDKGGPARPGCRSP